MFPSMFSRIPFNNLILLIQYSHVLRHPIDQTYPSYLRELSQAKLYIAKLQGGSRSSSTLILDLVGTYLMFPTHHPFRPGIRQENEQLGCMSNESSYLTDRGKENDIHLLRPSH